MFRGARPLLRKSMDWFLYDNGFRHERIKHTTLKYIRLNYFKNTVFSSLLLNLWLT